MSVAEYDAPVVPGGNTVPLVTVSAPGFTADWFTVKVCPAMVMVPLRAPPVLAATVKPTGPLPDPVFPELMVIKDALLEADHPHPWLAITFTELAPPAAPNDWLPADSEYVQLIPGVMVRLKIAVC